MPTNTYTTKALMVSRLSQLGVDLRTDHESIDNLCTLAANRASDEVEMELGPCYTLSSLAANTWVIVKATDLGCFYLDELRNNIASDSSARCWKTAKDELRAVKLGAARVPNATRITGG